MEEIHPSLIFMSDFYFGPARPLTPKPLTGSAQQRGSPRVSRARLPAAGHGCPSSHGGMEPSWEQPPLPQSWLDHDVPFLLSRSKGERSIVSQFVKPKSFNSTLSLKDAAFYMKIRASKKKKSKNLPAMSINFVPMLAISTAQGCCKRLLKKVSFVVCLHTQYVFPSHPTH